MLKHRGKPRGEGRVAPMSRVGGSERLESGNLGFGGLGFEVGLLLIPSVNDNIPKGRGIKSLLVLEFGSEVDAVVFTDVADGLWRKLLGFRGDAHGVEDVTSGGEVTGESTGADVSQTSELALADETVFIVEVNHKIVFRQRMMNSAVIRTE